MRLTRAGEYAVRCVLYLAKKEKGALVSRREVAEQTETPDQFLAKIVQQLAKAGIIEIIQGAAGGYRLLREPGEITLLEVVEQVIGGISLNDCVARPQSCTRSATCSVHKVWVNACEQLRATLGAADFATLAADDNCCLAMPPSPRKAGKKPQLIKHANNKNL